MQDLALTESGDLALTAQGDLQITPSLRQAVQIRLNWFKAEWRLIPAYGMDYYGEILKKKPNLNRIKAVVRQAVLEVEAIEEVSVAIKEWKNRQLKITLQLKAGREVWQEELLIAG